MCEGGRFFTEKKQIIRKLADGALAAAVLFGALALAWQGVRGTRKAANVLSVFEEHEPASSVIVIDAGHGGFDGGATGSRTGVRETELNLAVARLLERELVSRGYSVVMTRTDDDAVGETKGADMENRKLIMRDERACVVISIHMNKFTDPTVSGPMVFYMNGSERGKALADCIMYSLCEALGRPQRCSNPEDLFVLRVPEAPSVLVECGFLSNPEDEALLTDPEHQKKLAAGVADGLADYFARLNTGDND